MKTKRLLFLVMAICLASGVKAQFYDEADDIYYYVEDHHEYEEIKSTQDSYFDFFLGRKMYLPTFTTTKTGKIIKEPREGDSRLVMVFNFDGKKAADLTGVYRGWDIPTIKKILLQSPSYYEDEVETTDYNLIYSSSSYKEIKNSWKSASTNSSWTVYKKGSELFVFSPDRNTLILDTSINHNGIIYYKRVDKSFFKVGRSRTPSNTMHE